MSLPVPPNEIRRRKALLAAFMEENALSCDDVVALLGNTLRPVSLRTVKAWIADPALTSARTPPAVLVDELRKRLSENRPA